MYVEQSFPSKSIVVWPEERETSVAFQDDQLTWKEETFHGEWTPGSTAGGSGQPNKGLSFDSIVIRGFCSFVFVLFKKNIGQILNI